jgi:hypothetical protein
MNFLLTLSPVLFSSACGLFFGWRVLSVAPWADLSRHVQKAVPRPPKIEERNHRDRMMRVFHQAPIAPLLTDKLALDYPKRILDLGLDARLGALEIIQQLAQRLGEIQQPSLARAHRHVPLRLYRLRVFALVHSLITVITKHQRLVLMRQGIRLHDVAHVVRCT